MAFIDEDELNMNEKEMKPSQLSFRYGTSIMPTLVRGVIGKLPPHLNIIDPRKFDDEAKMDFAANLSTSRRRGKHLELDGRYPSVSALLGAAEDDLTKLHKWQADKVLELGYDGLRKYMEKAEEENRGYIEGIIPFLKTIKKTDWMKLEKATKNHYYCFQGRFDAIIEIEGEPTLVDWKTVSSASYKHHGVNDLKRLYGVPLQVCAYIACVNTDPDYQAMPKIKQGAVVLAYEDGRPAEAVIIRQDDLKEYYKTLAEKINSFWWKMLHPRKGDKDRNGNINFVFNPALHPPASKEDNKEPDVVVLDDEVIIDSPTASTEDQKPKEEVTEKPAKTEQYYAIFEAKSKKATTTTSDGNSNSKVKKSVFGV
uniref:PD-(D/E)XK endonuclease-like domain-containing protein n=1 Tax=Panagrolaimus sp. PS1159 TaxID=55785 RepID=A0AC35FBQ8_9BILA